MSGKELTSYISDIHKPQQQQNNSIRKLREVNNFVGRGLWIGPHIAFWGPIQRSLPALQAANVKGNYYSLMSPSLYLHV